MKYNIKLIILLLISIFIISGCNNEEKNIMTCTKSDNLGNDVTMEASYNVKYDGLYVTSIETKEILTSKDINKLEKYKQSYDNINKQYKDIDYYNVKTEIKDNKLISTLNIDYTKIDIDELKKVNEVQAQILVNGKLRLSDVKSNYEDSNIKCIIK